MAVMKTTREIKGVGLAIPRPDGPEKVTGQVQYVADIKPKGMLHAKLLRSPHAHARIVKIDTTRARALPGVRAIVTARDIPELKRKAPTRAHAVLAIDRVVFVGQPVAAVAADELAIAEEACDLIDVQYEVLPASVDPLKAMQVGAPPVADAGTEADTSEALAHSGVAVAKTVAAPTKAVNISQQAKLGRGDVAKAFAESDVIVEKTYRVPMVHRGISSRTPCWPSGTATDSSRSTRARRAPSTRAPKSRTSCTSRRTGSRSSRWSAAVASAARSARSASPSPRSWPASPSGRCATS
ncbi:MAG TPA: xanthine dehydrogenase family protein [Candidatus Acidoferrum sp.]|nr:xanthine dehydrogenase family protein [Candidatus Acidoferrum sp.]